MKIQSTNPHDKSIIGQLQVSSKEDVANAVNKAHKAFDSWRHKSIQQRLEYIDKFRGLVKKNKDEIAKIQTLEMGKPLSQSLDDIDFELGFLDYYIEKGSENLADETILREGNENYRVTLEPHGVVAAIAPWNFPLSMANSGIIPAIIAGNTVVFKPSEYTSLSQKKVVELLWETGLPEGVVNLVIGDGNIGKILVDSDVDFIWFTGSTKVGKEIYKKAGDKFIKAVCELGGSSAGIVFADADLKLTLDNIYWAKFLNCGQVCNAVKRLFIEKSVYGDVLQKYIDQLKKAKVGDPMEEVDFGPLASKEQLKRLEIQVEDAVSKGAKVEIGGKRSKDPKLAKGNYFEPTIITNVNFEMKVMNEEVFGPVLPVMSFEGESEAIKLANKTEYGLTSEVYTKDLEKAERVAKELQSGVVAINTMNYYKPVCPIGGYKSSGIGREYGKIGMQEFAQLKLIAVLKP